MSLIGVGSHNTFRNCLTSSPTLHFFTADDIQLAFDRTAENGKMELEKIGDFFEVLYRGPARQIDVEMFRKFLSIPENDSFLKIHQFLQAFKACKAHIEHVLSSNHVDDIIINNNNNNNEGDEPNIETTSTTTTTTKAKTSFQEHKDAMRRHIRQRHGPKDILRKPLTSNQDYGRHNNNNTELDMTERFPKKSCPETLYAREVLKKK